MMPAWTPWPEPVSTVSGTSLACALSTKAPQRNTPIVTMPTRTRPTTQAVQLPVLRGGWNLAEPLRSSLTVSWMDATPAATLPLVEDDILAHEVP